MKKVLFLIIMLMSQMTFAQPIQVIIPYPPGGGTDNIYRLFEKYCKSKNIDLVPIYKPGAEGSIGVNALINSPKNNKVIGITSTLSLTELDNEVELVSLLGTPKFLLVSSNKSQITSFDELERLVKQKKPFSIGAAGTSHHDLVKRLLFELGTVESELHIKVPFAGGSQQIPAILGGHVDLGFMTVLTALKQASIGNINIIASTTSIEGLDVVDLSKKYKNWKNTNSYGLILPKENSSDVGKYWQNVAKGFLADKEIRSELNGVYYDTPKFGSHAFKKLIEEGKNGR